MNESDVRHILLARAFESPPAPPWSEADTARVTREAQRIAGESASAERWLAQRARLATTTLAECESAVARALGATAGHRWAGAVLALLTFALGVAGDAVGSSGRINILAPPLLALLLWNLGVYALLVIGTLHASTGNTIGTRFVQWLGARASDASAASSRDTLARFVADWLQVGRPLIAARAARALHAAAAALAAGALASLYLRGLAFEYRAGWDSTFLGASTVHGLLSLVLGPAAALSGVPLPAVDELARLRFSAGNGENAARWIHLQAITLGIVVIVPRCVLAALAAMRAHRLAANLPFSIAGPYFTRLAHQRAGRPLGVCVVPYSYRLGNEARSGLAPALEAELGAAVELTIAAVVDAGHEDVFAAPDSNAVSLVVALFASTATPERETHGVFLRRLFANRREASQRLVLVDESAFRTRFTGSEGAARRVQRRAAWQKLLDDEGQRALFVDLGATAAP